MLLFIRIFSLLPLSFLYVLSDTVLYPFLRYIMRYRLSLVRKNIRFSFPEKLQEEQNALVNAFYHHFADVLVEIIYGYRASDVEMQERVVFDNIELVEQLAQQTQGVIAYLGHMCNWEWIADFHKRVSIPNFVEYNVYRRQKNKNVDAAMLRLRSKRGGECVEKNMLLRKLVQLRREEHPFLVGLIADQKPSPRSSHVWTTFLNQDTAFLDGGEQLARKFGYGVVYVNIVSPKRGYYRVHFQVITDNPSSMAENQITLTFAQMIESNIRQQPERWLWTHNRWKWSRPI